MISLAKIERYSVDFGFNALISIFSVINQKLLGNIISGTKIKKISYHQSGDYLSSVQNDTATLGNWIDIYHCLSNNETGCGVGTKPQVS